GGMNAPRESMEGATFGESDIFGRRTRYGDVGAINPNQIYTPNAGDTFYDNQDERDRLYFEWRNEKDPARKAELKNHLDQWSRRLGGSLRRPAGGKATAGTTKKAASKAKRATPSHSAVYRWYGRAGGNGAAGDGIPAAPALPPGPETGAGDGRSST